MNPLVFLPSLPAAATAIGAITQRVGQGLHSFAAALEAATGPSTGTNNGTDAKAPAAQSESPADVDPRGLYERLVGSAASFTGEPIRFSDLDTHARQTLDYVEHELRRQLRAAGIEDVQSVRLQIRPGDGQIVASGDPAIRAAVEQIFEQDPRLANMLRRAIGTSELVRAGNENMRFSLAFEDDPLAALARFSQLFDDNHRGTTSILLDEFGAEVEFT